MASGSDPTQNPGVSAAGAPGAVGCGPAGRGGICQLPLLVCVGAEAPNPPAARPSDEEEDVGFIVLWSWV